MGYIVTVAVGIPDKIQNHETVEYKDDYLTQFMILNIPKNVKHRKYDVDFCMNVYDF